MFGTQSLNSVLVHSKELLRTPKNFCLCELHFLIHSVLEENTICEEKRHFKKIYLLIKLKTAIQNSLYVNKNNYFTKKKCSPTFKKNKVFFSHFRFSSIGAPGCLSC